MNVAGSADQIDAPKGTRNCRTKDCENLARRTKSAKDSSAWASNAALSGSRSDPVQRASLATSRRAARLKRVRSASRRTNDGFVRLRRWAKIAFRLEPRYSRP